ncbi:MAG: hypothetical protein IJY75_09500 [Bacteroidaceae bacterium]|nr:hypothetical protein [Bacteroidaceae bacterium]
MTTKKKGYVKPIIATEEFVPQEYVAVCYKLKCDTTEANAYERSIGNEPYGGHRTNKGCCGHIDSQVINTTKEGIITEIYELHTEDGVTTKLRTECAYIGSNLKDLINNNTKITWTTYYQYGNNEWVYNHQGTPEMNGHSVNAS